MGNQSLHLHQILWGEDEIDPGTRMVVVTMRDKSVNYRVRMDIVVLPCLRGHRSEFPTIP